VIKPALGNFERSIEWETDGTAGTNAELPDKVRMRPNVAVVKKVLNLSIFLSFLRFTAVFSFVTD
jgi:hypothetical protein